MDKTPNTDTEILEPKEATLLQSISKNAFGLALFAFITAGVIALVQLNTSDLINENIAQAQAKALYEITPKDTINNDILNDTLSLTNNVSQRSMNINLLGPISSDANIYFSRQDNEIKTLIFPSVAPDGYTTTIKLLVGIHLDGTIAGVRIIDHKETPGLGDKVELKKSDWVLSFNNKSLSKPNIEDWKVKKDGGEFDQFTGATITPRAVVNKVKQTLEFYRLHKDDIFELKKQQDLSYQEKAKLKKTTDNSGAGK